MVSFASSKVTELAKQFWMNTMLDSVTYPCDLQRAVAYALPVDIISLSQLSISKIKEYFISRQLSFQLPDNDAPLHGFIYAYKGTGLIFINGADDPAERYFTIAHEIAHFILDYQEPRTKAVGLFGESITEVLDGLRPPTIQERLDGLLNLVDLSPYQYLLSKDSNTYNFTIQVLKSEDLADALAFEIIAPFNLLYKDLKKIGRLPYTSTCRAAEDILVKNYGLPSSAVKGYARQLAFSITGGKSPLEQMGLL